MSWIFCTKFDEPSFLVFLLVQKSLSLTQEAVCFFNEVKIIHFHSFYQETSFLKQALDHPAGDTIKCLVSAYNKLSKASNIFSQSLAHKLSRNTFSIVWNYLLHEKWLFSWVYSCSTRHNHPTETSCIIIIIQKSLPPPENRPPVLPDDIAVTSSFLKLLLAAILKLFGKSCTTFFSVKAELGQD